MIRSGQLALLSFPQTDQAVGRLRPTLVLRRLPGPYDDWLVCMISSQLRHEVTGVDEVVREADLDFADTGLKATSVIRVTRIGGRPVREANRLSHHCERSEAISPFSPAPAA